MSKELFNADINGINLKITEDYIQYVNDIIPSRALSFVSLKRPNVIWWAPILLLIAAIIIFTEFGMSMALEILLLTPCVIWIVYNIIQMRKRFLWIYSHSGKNLCIECKKKDMQPVINAIYKLIEYTRINETKLENPNSSSIYEGK